MVQLNTLPLGYRNKSYIVVWGNNHCFFWDPYTTCKRQSIC